MPTYRLLLEYDGAAFHGWQKQPAVPTVQGAVEHALALLTRREIATAGAGRTDRGVHASGQVVSFSIPGAGQIVDPRRLISGIHGICGPAIRVRMLEEAPEGFHARFDAIWRQYHYRILDRPSALWRERAHHPRRPVTLPALREASRVLIGEHDFTSFANKSPDDPDPHCRVLSAEWDCWEGGFLFQIRADRFLYKMVRTIVGTLLREADGGEVGGGAAVIARILAARSRREAAGPAPAPGLCLDAVGYDPPWPAG